jgi:hypothetical protein
MFEFIGNLFLSIVAIILTPILIGSFFLGLLGDIGRNGNRPE